MHDIIIIGAGVAGCACARELSRYSADILVLEKEEDVCCGTSKANSAIVHAGYDAAHGSLMAKLNVEGSRRMPALAKELDFAYAQCGSLVVCLSEEDRPALQKLYENGIANGVEGLRIIERDELVEKHSAPLRLLERNIQTQGVVAEVLFARGLYPELRMNPAAPDLPAHCLRQKILRRQEEREKRGKKKEQLFHE